jgi:hypothetical protein
MKILVKVLNLSSTAIGESIYLKILIVISM